MGLFTGKKEVVGNINFNIEKAGIASLPDLQNIDKTRLDIRYPLILPYAYVHIFWDDANHELVYFLEEPKLDLKEKTILNLVEEGIRELINISFISTKSNEVVVDYLKKNILVLLDELGISISEDSFLKIMYYVYRDFVGLNEIEALMNDYYIEDIQCNGYDAPLYIVHRKYKNMRTNVIFETNDKLTSFVEKLAQKCGKYISYASPLLDAALPDLSRVNATYTSEISSRGPNFTIRKFTTAPWSPTKMMQVRTLSAEMLAYLWLLIQYERNIMVIGGTGSGKCVTGDTLVHLGNGEIKPIKEIIEEKFKKKHIFSENGWEYTFGDGTKVLSLDVNTLRVQEKPISNFFRHKAPEKLYKITTRSGRIIKTTPEHPFFGFNNGKLVKIRADNLSLGERVAVPRNISLNLNKENPNLIDGLLDEEDIYAFGVADLIKDIFNNLKEKYSLNEKKMCKKLGIDYFTARFWKTSNAIPLKTLNKLAKTAGLKLDDRVRIKAKTSAIIVKIPSLNKNLFRFLALVLGDGHLTKKHVELHNSDQELLNEFINLGYALFGVKSHIEYPKGRVTKVRISSVPVARILHKLFQIPYGDKASKIIVPDLLFKQDNECISSFVSGIIDTDAHISDFDIDIGMNSRKFLRQLSTLLLRLNVTPICRQKGRPRVIISGFNNVKKLSSQITLNCKYRWQCLGYLLFRNRSKTISNVDLIPNVSEWIKNLRMEKGLTQKDIASKSGVSRSLVGSWERNVRLPSNNTFSAFAEAIDIPHIKTIAESDIYWDEIEDIEILKDHGEDYVYDLTVDEHHNFLAGDIPLIVHNTSLLNSLAFFIPPASRIVSIEDTKELNLLHENWLPSVARQGIGIEGKKGEIDLFTLLKESFRQRPDYVIVGEIRGNEAYVLFQGMSSGHPSFGTMHAEDVDTMIRRLETPPINLSPALVESLDAVCVMTQSKIGDSSVRRVREITEVVSLKGSKPMLNAPFAWDPRKDIFYFKTKSTVFDKIAKQYGLTIEELEKELKLRSMLLIEMYRRGIFGFKEVQDVISAYYKTPEYVLRRFGIIK